MKSALIRSLIFLLLIGFVYSAALVEIKKGETKKFRFTTSELKIDIDPGSWGLYPKINGSYPLPQDAYETFDVKIGEYTSSYDVHLDRMARDEKDKIFVTETGVKSTKAQDMVDTLKAREEKLIVHFRDGHEKEESVPTIKFGKDGNDNTIEISLSSQNSLDHLKLRVINAEEFVPSPVSSTTLSPPVVAAAKSSKLWLYIGIPAGVVILLLIVIGGVVGLIFYKRRDVKKVVPTYSVRPSHSEMPTVGASEGGKSMGEEVGKSIIIVSKPDEAGAKSQMA